MADNDVRIKLSLDGDKQVASGLAGVGDGAEQADSKFKSLIGGGLAGTGKALVGLGAAAVAAGGVMSGAVIKAYADYEQNLGGIETMFKDSSETMIKYADQAYMTSGLSANAYMSQVTSFSASLLQGLGGDTAAAAEIANTAMVDMSDNANKFGTNIASIQDAYQGFAKQNYTMLDNLKLGYGGTATEMARLINDSGVLGDTMQVTAENVNDVSFDKIIEAIHTVQDEMGIAGTTAAEAEATISGSIGMLQASFENLLTGLGDADADVATLAGNVISSLETVIGNVTPIIENIGAHMATLGPQLGTMMEGLVGAVAGAIPAVIQAGTGMIEGLISGVISALPGLITAIIPGIIGLVEMISTQLPLLVDAGLQAVIALAQGLAAALPTLIPMAVEMITGIVDSLISNLPMLLDAALQLIMGLAQGLIDSIPVLIEALPDIIEGITVFLITAVPSIIMAAMELLLGIVKAIPDVIVAIVEALPQIIEGIINGIMTALPMLVEAGIELFTALIEALPEIIEGIVEAIPQIIQALVTFFRDSGPELAESGKQLLSKLGQRVGEAAQEIAGKIPQIITRIASAVGRGAKQLVDAGYNLIAGMWEGISSAGSWLYDKVMGWAGDLLGGVKDFFGIKSPSTVMRDQVGKQLPAGLGEGVEDNEQAAIKPLQDLNDKIIGEAKKIAGLEFNTTVAMAPGATVPTNTAIPTMFVAGNAQAAAPTSLAVDSFEMPINIRMYDRDPRIVGKQLGRQAKGVLVG